jgi:short-subunit dehydrogenase
MRLELAGSGVQVGVVVPAAVSTGFFTARGRAYDRRIPRTVEPELVARAVVRAVAQDRAETWLPRWIRAAAVVRVMFPGLYRRLATRFGESIRSG